MAAASSSPHKRRIRLNTPKINLILDLFLALAFVVDLEYHFTGLTLHELIGLALGITLLVHILLHWGWIVSITRKFFNKLFHESRLNYLLNILVFVDLFVITLTGLAISRTLGLNLGLDRSLMQTFERLHILASNFSLVLIGLHVGLHWKWIVTYTKKYLLRLPFRRQRPAVTLTSAVQQTSGGAS